MPFATGSRLGPYEITGTLGAGGMGEVYRARDTRLGREVAIKILPAELSSSQDRLNRFEQEARSASSLNHPNMITIHEIGSDNSTRYIAMELVDGKTLRELVSAGPLPLRKTLSIATQIAEGLAKAHSAGIIHRDLKPENIMISKDGFVKILDFGLAKLFSTGKQEEVSSLQTAAGTNAGIILGTIGYMSPEQASGGQIDFRSDQFSLGSILYEMVTGQRAFHKKTTVETLAAIINQDPQSIASVNAEVPAPVRWLIERCLAKDPADRFASTDDLARDLKSIRDHISEVSASEAVSKTVLPQIAKKGFLNAWNIAGLLVIAALATALFFALKQPGKTSSQSALNYHRLTYAQGYLNSARFTADGQTIVYSGAIQGKPKDLYMTRTEGVESRELGVPIEKVLSTGPEGMLVLLPNNTLAQVPLTGGTPRELFTNVSGACWFPDGTKMAMGRKVNGRGRLEVPPGNVIYSTPHHVEMIRVSPKGDLIAFNERTFGSNGSVVIVDIKGKKLAATEEIYPFGIAWGTGTDEVWYSSWNLGTGLGSMLRGLSPTGKDRLIQNFPFSAFLLDISSQGNTLLSFDEDRKICKIKLKTESMERDFSWLDGTSVVDISSDRKTSLIHENYEGSDSPNGTIYIRTIDGSPAIRLAPGTPSSFTPDGKWAMGIQGSDIKLVPTGAGEIRKIPTTLEFTYPYAFLPDEKHILISGIEKGKTRRFYVLNVLNGAFRPVTEELGVSEESNEPRRLSPDGKLFFTNDLDQKFYVNSIEGEKRFAISGLLPEEKLFQWTADSKSVYVFNPAKFPVQVFKVDVRTGKRTFFIQLLLSDYAGVQRVSSIRIASDESFYAYHYTRTISTLYMIDGLK